MLFKYFSIYTPPSWPHTSKVPTTSTMTTPSSSSSLTSIMTPSPSSSLTSTMTPSTSESQTSLSYLPSSPKTPTSKKHKLDGRIQPMELAPKDLKTFHVPPCVRRNLLDSFEKATTV